MYKIAIDLDNTIFNVEQIYKNGFKDLIYYPPQTWDLFKCYPKKIALEIIESFKNGELYNCKPFYDDYPELIRDLRYKYQVYYVTTRKSSLDPVIFNGKQIPGVIYNTYKQLTYNGIKSELSDIKVTEFQDKVPEFRNLDINFVIDDSPLVIESCLNNNIDCAMVSDDNMKYNHYLRKKVLWGKNLHDIRRIKGL